MESYYHWIELKFRFFYSLLSFSLVASLAFLFKLSLFSSIASPILDQGLYFIYTDLSEPFFAWFKFSFLFSFFFNLPFFLFHFSSFFKSGLFLSEWSPLKSFFSSFILFFFLLLLLSLKGLHLLLFPFFLDFQLGSLDFCGKLSEFISFLSLLSLSLLFLPLLIFSSFLFFFHFPHFFSSSRAFILLFSFIFSSLITPPDVFSQFLFAFPTFILFEISFFFVLLFKSYYPPSLYEAQL